ncbi:MAG TPA: hypothetical protein VD735_05455 [Candidatus Saccharimonadales bacterium]|nr:hypothetical protein [Candidatus Saccharimonadales bacterium]
MRAQRGEGTVDLTGNAGDFKLAQDASRLAESAALLLKAAGVRGELSGDGQTDDMTRRELAHAAIRAEEGMDVADVTLTKGQAETLSTDMSVAAAVMGVFATAHEVAGNSDAANAFRYRATHFADLHAPVEHDLFPEGRR